MKSWGYIWSQGIKQLFTTKAASVFLKEEADDNDSGLVRSMSLFDLICVGVGGTVGTGVFVLTGYIAVDYAGPSVIFSFIIGGLSCLVSAASYGELASRIPSAGSTYAYSFYALGEFPAIIAAWCLTLEYGVSGAAVARSWGDKLTSAIESSGYDMSTPLDDYNINLFAGFIQLACVILLLVGVQTGKVAVNSITVFKVMLVLFMIFGGFAFYNESNLTPMFPMGFSGTLSGATVSFFAFIGFDEV